MSNLKQLGIACRMYWNESGEYLRGDTWFSWGGFDSGSVTTTNGIPPISQRQVTTELPNSAYKCPDDNRNKAISVTSWSWGGTSYVANTYSGSQKNFSARLVEQSMDMLLGDTTMYMANGTYTWNGQAGHYTWHSDRGWWSNILFYDLHAAYVRIEGNVNTPQYNWSVR